MPLKRLLATDLDGTYFTSAAFTFTVSAMDPLAFEITATAANSTRAEKPAAPATYMLNELGEFTPG